MKRVDCKQGTHEWRLARIGIPTASQFPRIITPKTRKLSSQAVGYRNELLAELLFGEPLESASTQFMERGSDLEADAVRRFELDRNCDVDRVGFCLRDDKRVGCSPDGLVGDDEGLEIKTLSAAHHVGALLDTEDDKYICQIQGGLYVTGRKRWTRMYYHPTLPPVYVCLERNDGFIADLHNAVEGFLESLEDGKARLREKGCTPKQPRDPQAFCRALRPDGRWCMIRRDVTMTEAGWRCGEHAAVMDPEGVFA